MGEVLAVLGAGHHEDNEKTLPGHHHQSQLHLSVPEAGVLNTAERG
jgi:hypothetical protein